MVCKCIDIGGSWDFTRTASTTVERTRLLIALAASDWIFSGLLIVVAVSQGAHASASYSSLLCTIAL